MLSVLIVDDEKITREGIKANIGWEALGYGEPVLAADGEEASALLTRFKPDVVLCDIRMPRMDGMRFGELLSEKHPECRLIFLSGYTDKEYLKTAITLHAVEYLEKPIEAEALERVLKKTAQAIESERAQKNKAGVLSMERLVLDLTVPHESQTIEWLIDSGLPMPMGGSYLSIVAQADSEAAGEAALNRAALEDAFRREIDNAGLFCVAAFIGGLFTAHVSDSREDSLSFYAERMEEVLRRASEGTRGIWYISVGKKVRGLLQIHESYQSAVLLLQRRFFWDDRAVFCCCGSPGVFTLSEKDAGRFREMLKRRDAAESEQFIGQAAEAMRRDSLVAASAAKAVFFQLFTLLLKAAEERNISLSETSESAWKKIEETESLRHLTRFLLEKTAFYFSSVGGMERYGSLAQSVLQCIEENYAIPKMSVKWIAQRQRLTVTYLCMAFKSRTGKTINQCITETRLKKAKHLLKDKSVKLYDVAAQVGYDDPNYFSKLFKKQEGMNPSEYRKRFLL